MKFYSNPLVIWTLVVNNVLAIQISSSTKQPYVQLPSFNESLTTVQILDNCKRSAKCEPLINSTCMGSKLPYASTTLDLTNMKSQERAQEKLKLYEEYLRYIPKCWAVIQPFLCALYMPKCEDNKVNLPTKRMCKDTLEPCKIILNTKIFPEVFKCEDEHFFPSGCESPIHEMKFNTVGYCMEPLIRTNDQDWWFKDIDGCGLQCEDPKFTPDEYSGIYSLIWSWAIACIFLQIVAISTFLIAWKTSRRYPVQCMFYVNLCFAVSYFGYIVQFFGTDARKSIVCRMDGTIRKSGPRSTENLTCIGVFVIVYYFLIAGLVWFMLFCFAWYMKRLQALAKTHYQVDKKGAYFHLVAWSLPLVLTITSLTVQEIDGDYATGICFIGFNNMTARSGLFLAPYIIIMAVCIGIIGKGVMLLIQLQIGCKEILSRNACKKIRWNILRFTLFCICVMVFSTVTVYYHIYVGMNKESWDVSLHNYIMLFMGSMCIYGTHFWNALSCKLKSFSDDYSHCKHSSRPSVALIELYLLAEFGRGIAMTSWIWGSPAIQTWKRFIRKKLHMEKHEQIKIQGHKVIPRAFAGREKYNAGECISVFSQSYTDPMGLHIELNSDDDLGESFIKSLPRIVNRRAAIPNEEYCIENDYSLSYRQVSIESRRSSGDSSISVQIAELTATRRTRRRDKPKFKRHSKRNERSSSKKKKKAGKRSCSLDSSLSSLAAGNDIANMRIVPNLDRRGGIHADHIEELFANPNAGILFSSPSSSSSEEENVSVTISETAICNRVVTISENKRVGTNQNLDLNDQFTINQLQQAFYESQRVAYESDQSYRAIESGRRNNNRKHSRSRRTGSSVSPSSSNEDYQQDDAKNYPRALPSSPFELEQQNDKESRQSKTSMDVAVQANADDLDLEMQNCHRSKSKKNKHRYRTSENSDNSDESAKRNSYKMRKIKKHYKFDGSDEENNSLI